MMNGGDWIWWHTWGWGSWLLMGVALVLSCLALTAGLVLAIRYLKAASRSQHYEDDAGDTLVGNVVQSPGGGISADG